MTWSTRLTRLDKLLLVLAMAVAVFFRTWQHDRVPPGMDFDEAFESLQAYRILNEPGYHPVFFPENNGVPPANIYMTALALLITGGDPMAIRTVAGVAGTLTVVALYVLARRLFPLPVAVDLKTVSPEPGASATARRFLPFMASLVLAVLPWHTAFSRHGLEVILLPLWAVLAVYTLWQGLVTSRRWLFAVSGFFWGTAFYTYQAAWMLPGLLVLFVIYKAFQEPGFLRRYAGHLLLLALCAALVLLPLLQFAYAYRGAFVHRSTQVGIFALGQGSQTPLLTLGGNVLKTAALFVAGGDMSIADNITTRPPLPLASTALLAVGLLVTLRRIKGAVYGLLLLWFAWMLVPTIITENAPSIRRAIGATPALALLIALGIAWLFDVAASWARRAVVPAATLAVAAFIAYQVAWGYDYYFLQWAQIRDLYHYYDVGLVDAGKHAASTPAGTRLYYTPALAGNVVHLPLAWQVRGRELAAFDGAAGLVLPPEGTPGLYLVTVFLGDQDTLPALQRIYPDGRQVYESRNLYGVSHTLAYAVDAGAIPALDIQHRATANFGNQIELLGASFSAAELNPGDPFTVTLFWRSLSGPTDVDYTVFTHLAGPPNPASGSQVWAGHDSPPLNHSYPTGRWVQGEIVVDRHSFTVPTEVPPGAYRIETGLYAPALGGARLSTVEEGATPRDSVPVGDVAVR